ncbi:arsenate reductase (glutaredoxin) [Celerinatantimonas sp. MCCC 1A17872]|uniref:arsenate reductase (glutaredoxin) n=1 Tax=Celerinatantimonas sp. MCCC 1A17872 TaxID=3177514 RepID=UPI0038C67834
MTVTIYHNPRCSKSRQTLELLKEHTQDIAIVEYLKTPPDAATLKDLLAKLAIPAKDLVRRKEALFKELDLSEQSLSEQQWIDVLAQHPKLIERPIVVNGDKAVIGRPPENISALFSK